MDLKEFEWRMYSVGAKIVDDAVVLENDKFAIVLTRYGEELPEVFVSSSKGFITETLNNIFDYPDDILISILWEEYLIPSGIMTQEEYENVKRK